MRQQFEDYFSKLQADMVDVCLEYVDDKADDIYIYCSYEPKMYSFNVFYKINGKAVHKHKLNEASDYPYDVSGDRQSDLLKIGNKDLQLIHQTCQEFNRDMPTEMKLHYNVKENSLNGKYKYELVYSQYELLHPNDIFEQWFENVKNGLDE